MSLSAKLGAVASTPEDITAEIAEYSQTETMSFVILNKGPDAVYADPMRETAEYFGNVEITDTAGDTYTVDMKAFGETYDIFRHNNGATVYASKALGDRSTQTEAFVNTVADLVNKHRTEASTTILSLATADEMKKVEVKAQHGISQGGWADCSANGTSAAPQLNVAA